MSGSFSTQDALGSGVGGWIAGLCVLVVLVLLAPIGLAALGFAAILALVGGSPGAGGQVPTTPTTSITVVQGEPVAGNQPVVLSAHGLVDGWANRGSLNQYARDSYRTDQSWLTWRNADCSAAALHWLLGAYGQQLGGLEDAIALIGPNTGISTSFGLLDASGSGLAHALAARGLLPRTPGRHPLGSIAELEGWLGQGPLLMDGAGWFGVGHWFVAIGYDHSGVYIRESSGNDNRYLSWSRLYGEVGFDGWVVGVAP